MGAGGEAVEGVPLQQGAFDIPVSHHKGGLLLSLAREAKRLLGRLLRYPRARLTFAIVVWRSDFCPFLPPWSMLRDDPTHVGRLRRRAIDIAWSRVVSLHDWPAFAAFGVLWPVVCAWRATRMALTQGDAVHATTGKSRTRQWMESMRYALRDNYSPVSYYQFRFFERHETAKEFIQVHEFYAMQTAINASADTRVLWSKVGFYEACVTAGVRTPSIIVFLGRGTERWFRTPGQQLPRGSIFIKRIDGQQGIGNERWEYALQDERWTRKGTSLSHDDMLSYCRRKGTEHSLIVQPAIRNHAEIDRFNASALCTLRVMTYRNEGEQPKLIRACFKIARHGAEVDNLYGGAIASGVDPHSGVIGPAYGKMPSQGVHANHPDNTVAIAGSVLHGFAEAIDAAIAAHAALAVPWSVGWDIAITPDGPMVLEGNLAWGSDLAQIPHGAPFDAEFIEQLSHRLLARR